MKSRGVTVRNITQKLDGLAKLLNLYPYDSNGNFEGKLKTVSYKSIQAVQVICPYSITCETASCNPRSLLQKAKLVDIPRVTLIKGSEIYENVQVLCFPMFSCVYPYFLLSSPYLALIVLSLLSFILYLLYSTTRTLFPLCTSFCSLISFYIYLTMRLPHASLLCTYINSLVGTYSVVR